MRWGDPGRLPWGLWSVLAMLTPSPYAFWT